MNRQWMGQFPLVRPRRLRQTEALRRLVAEARLHPDQPALPCFVRAGRKAAVSSMPGVFQLSVDDLLKEAERAHTSGLRALLLFGIPETKDEKASGAYGEHASVQKTGR